MLQTVAFCCRRLAQAPALRRQRAGTPLLPRVRRLKDLAAWEAGVGKPPPEPDNCCGIGCVDCVWISYWERMNAFAEAERERQGLQPSPRAAYVVPPPSPGGAGRGFTAADVSGQPRRKTGSTVGYKSKVDYPSPS